MVAVARPHGVGLAGFAELFQGVLAHRLQQPVAGSAPAVVGDHQRLVHQQRELIEHLVALHVTAAGDRLGGVEVESAQKHRQPAKQDPLGFGQQRVRPVHRGAQGLLAAYRGARTAGQQPEPVMQAVEDFGQRQRAHPCGGELDRQRQPIEARADFGHDCGVVVGDGEIGASVASPVGEQFDGFVAKRQRRHPPAHLAGHTDRLTAGGQQRQSRSGAEQRIDQRRTGVEQVLAVVQHHQHLPVGDKTGQGVHGGAAGLVGQPERAGHCDWHQLRVGDRRQIHIPHPVAEFAGQLARDLDCQPGFTRSTGTGQRHQPVPA